MRNIINETLFVKKRDVVTSNKSHEAFVQLDLITAKFQDEEHAIGITKVTYQRGGECSA